MLAFCSHTWWRKLEYPGKTTEHGWATTILSHAGNRTQAGAVTSERHLCAIQAPYSNFSFRLLFLVELIKQHMYKQELSLKSEIEESFEIKRER